MSCATDCPYALLPSPMMAVLHVLYLHNIHKLKQVFNNYIGISVSFSPAKQQRHHVSCYRACQHFKYAPANILCKSSLFQPSIVILEVAVLESHLVLQLSRDIFRYPGSLLSGTVGILRQDVSQRLSALKTPSLQMICHQFVLP